MGIADVIAFDSFRRLVAVRAALAAAGWASAGPTDAEQAADRLLREVDDPAGTWTGGPAGFRRRGRRRSRDELASVAEALQRRQCAGGPLVTRSDGVLDRLAPDEWIGMALAELARPRSAGEPDALPRLLAAMEIRSCDALRSFQRLVAAHAALAAVEWAAAPPSHAAAALADLLTEIDDPSSAWT